MRCFCCAMPPTDAAAHGSRKSAVLLFDEAHNLVRDDADWLHADMWLASRAMCV